MTNVKGGKAAVSASGFYDVNGKSVTFTAMLVANGAAVEAVDYTGFGLVLPVPAAAGVRTVFQLELDGREADAGIWTGEALIYSGSDGTKIDRMRVTSPDNGAALENVTFLYGKSEGAETAEIITISGSYVAA
ncbi:hypothetical protein ACGFYT_30140 [Streptomyces sp. NPDC048208]|uniref:hypothetical protein n=1 Tax=Streptomyces sp. NPDC048208 TaxID=3365515 RepID=UPI00371CF39A